MIMDSYTLSKIIAPNPIAQCMLINCWSKSCYSTQVDLVKKYFEITNRPEHHKNDFARFVLNSDNYVAKSTLLEVTLYLPDSIDDPYVEGNYTGDLFNLFGPDFSSRIQLDWSGININWFFKLEEERQLWCLYHSKSMGKYFAEVVMEYIRRNWDTDDIHAIDIESDENISKLTRLWDLLTSYLNNPFNVKNNSLYSHVGGISKYSVCDGDPNGLCLWRLVSILPVEVSLDLIPLLPRDFLSNIIDEIGGSVSQPVLQEMFAREDLYDAYHNGVRWKVFLDILRKEVWEYDDIRFAESVVSSIVFSNDAIRELYSMPFAESAKGIRVICSKVANRRMHQELAIRDFAAENQDEINRHLELREHDYVDYGSELMAPVILRLAVERDRFDDILEAGIYLLAKKISSAEFEWVSEDLFKQENDATRVSLLSSIKCNIIENDPWKTFLKIKDSMGFLFRSAEERSNSLYLEGLSLVESEIIRSCWNTESATDTVRIRKYLREKAEEKFSQTS